MKTKQHERARDLITASSVEGITNQQAAWLDEHLATCAECSQYTQAVTRTRQALHSVAFRVEGGLVAATQARVRMRARELRERDQRLIPVWIACAVAAAMGAVTTPYLWRAVAWIAHFANVPSSVWQAGFAMYWLSPAALIAILLIMLSKHGLTTKID